MNQRERCRLVIMSRVRDRAMTIRETSEVMRISYCQDQRIYKQYREQGKRMSDGQGRQCNREDSASKLNPIYRH